MKYFAPVSPCNIPFADDITGVLQRAAAEVGLVVEDFPHDRGEWTVDHGLLHRTSFDDNRSVQVTAGMRDAKVHLFFLPICIASGDNV
jgi:hypothetical protein